jgi:hypothetical protein
VKHSLCVTKQAGLSALCARFVVMCDRIGYTVPIFKFVDLGANL